MKLSTLAVIVWAAPSAAAGEKSVKVISFDKSKTSPPYTCEDFNTGVYHGADVAEYIWDEMGGSCSNVWGFEDAVDDYLDEHYPTDTSNWKTNSCNQGVEAGADQVVDKYEKQCLEESPDECYDLGHAAAQQIAYGYCPFSATEDEADTYGAPNYKASCRSVAYGVCEGAIYGYVRENGCSISTSKLDDLQDDCEDLIDAMTGGDEKKMELVKAPSAKPEKKVALTEEKSKSNMSCDGDFNDGVYLGAEVAEKMWKEMGSSCSNIWGFEDKVEDYIEVKYPTDTSDWRKNSCHQGVEAGADQVVDKYEKQCLDDSPDECNDLGHAAAQQIAYAYCPFSATEDEADTYGAPNYKASCRSVAYGVCEGAIYGYVRENGCSISTSKLDDLQDECEDLIDAMTGGETVLAELLRKKVTAVSSQLRTN